MNPPTQPLRDWPHAPIHRLSDAGAYIVTSGTHQKAPFFNSPERLTFLTTTILDLSEKYACVLQAWSVFQNHYHLILETSGPVSLKAFIRHVHSISARHVNKLDHCPDRKIWFQYWETHLTYPKSFLSRLHYVHSNAVRHRLVRTPEAYPWCSAAWFERTSERSFHRTVMNFPCDTVAVPDEFEVLDLNKGSIADGIDLNIECGASAPLLRSQPQ